ncbi:probable polygalacturonase At1g80170 [Hordeum vulgare subsp. vulgare]|uniref:Polygalacturonase n=1 Tax=Hordeum vulgare subsp. vulgare TaxID=112509 RepID=A0A8I6XJD0_HORVV|nr:probable polygalacturonase At1g80170 [Hordeum vulgare subsp. vulgare]
MALRARTTLLLAALAGAAAALLLPGAVEAHVLLSLDDFGAVGDGIANDTHALVDAWKAACATGGHTYLNVPVGKSYQIWPVTLAGPCRDEINLLISGNIIAPESPEEWSDGDQGRWLHFRGVGDLSLSGGGIVDGRGQQWWAGTCEDENCTSHRQHEVAPMALHFEDCRDVSVKGITVQNAQRQHLAFTRCHGVEASYLRVTSPEHSPATVGVLVAGSTDVHIKHDLFSVGGDCVSIVGDSSDIKLKAISCGPGLGISIGGLSQNQSDHRIHKIKTDTMFIANTKNGLSIYENGRGFVRKVKFEHVMMRNVANPISIDQNRSASNRGTRRGTPNGSAAAVDRIKYIDIAGTSATERAVTFACSDAMPCRRLYLDGVSLKAAGGGSTSAYCYQAFGKHAGDVLPESCLGKEDFVQLQAPAAGTGDGEDDDW